MSRDFVQDEPSIEIPESSRSSAQSPWEKELFSEPKKTLPPRRSRRFPILSVLALVVLVGGMVAALIASQTNLDLRQWAWGGMNVNTSGLNGEKSDLSQMSLTSGEDSETVRLFKELTKTYYQADVMNVSIPEFEIQGVVLKQYDPELDKTFVFSRMENLPLIQAVPRMWITMGDVDFPASVGEVVLESDKPVTYYLAIIEGDDGPYDTLHFSYDESIEVKEPNAPFLSIDFHEEEPIAVENQT